MAYIFDQIVCVLFSIIGIILGLYLKSVLVPLAMITFSFYFLPNTRVSYKIVLADSLTNREIKLVVYHNTICYTFRSLYFMLKSGQDPAELLSELNYLINKHFENSGTNKHVN